MQWYDEVLQVLLIGIANGAIIALIALGYTMVYGIVELINFAHGDVFMLGSFLTLTLIGFLGLEDAEGAHVLLGILLPLTVVPVFCAAINFAVDRVIYKPL